MCMLIDTFLLSVRITTCAVGEYPFGFKVIQNLSYLENKAEDMRSKSDRKGKQRRLQ